MKYTVLDPMHYEHDIANNHLGDNKTVWCNYKHVLHSTYTEGSQITQMTETSGIIVSNNTHPVIISLIVTPCTTLDL